MKMWKRIVALLLALLMITAALVSCKDDGKNEGDGGEGDGGEGNPPAAVKEIDIYFIAGQSNAAGTTKIEDAEKLYADYPELKSGTDPYIMYCGNSAGNVTKNNTVTYDWGSVKLGYGSNKSNMGPEVGIAKELSAYYNATTGKHAGIIKFAHGGTGLANTEVNHNFDNGAPAGNWSPLSYAKPTEGDSSTNYIGFLYRGLVSEAYNRISELKEMGYTKINIKGFYWMQGCNDTWRYSETPSDKKSPLWYPNAFAALVKDLRNDLKDMMQTVQGNFGGAQDMPFFIGTISPTYSLGNAKQGATWEDDGSALQTAKNRNDPFIKMQKQLAVDNSNCYIVDNGAYPTVDCVIENEGQPNQVVKYTMVGTDQSHWGQDDCYEIGRNVGKMMLEKCTK